MSNPDYIVFNEEVSEKTRLKIALSDLNHTKAKKRLLFSITFSALIALGVGKLTGQLQQEATVILNFSALILVALISGWVYLQNTKKKIEREIKNLDKN
jgi:hypothetical protein